MAAACVAPESYGDVGTQICYDSPTSDWASPNNAGCYWAESEAQQQSYVGVPGSDFEGMSADCGPWANGGSPWTPVPVVSDQDWHSQGVNYNGLSQRKRRFCTSFPDSACCRRGPSCTYAHSRQEIEAPLLTEAEERKGPDALTEEFFMQKYKTIWCPIGVQHEWHTCVYAHNYQDARRPVKIGYGARLCPYWSKKDTGAAYAQRCPLSLRCPHAHGAKEQLYHPHYFKTVTCRDLKGNACPRGTLCAFFHSRSERRATPEDTTHYQRPLDENALTDEWMADFLDPPFLPESNRQGILDEREWSNDGNIGECPQYMQDLQTGAPIFYVPISGICPNTGMLQQASSETSGGLCMDGASWGLGTEFSFVSRCPPEVQSDNTSNNGF